MTDEIDLLFTLGLGPWLTPLRGKVPVLDAWQSLPPADEPTVRDWLACGYNLGARMGHGFFVIDDDQPSHGGGPYVPPPTGLVATSPSGGRHYYYRAPTPCPGNSASRLAPHVDTRGAGGQVVVPPSVHPIARTPYRWLSTGEPGTLPTDVLEVLTPRTVRVDTTAPVATNGNGYADTALAREVDRVRSATEGARNDSLNRAAFSLGQLVAGGALSGDRVRAELSAAATAVGLADSESQATIRSGMSAGSGSPRSAPVHQRAVTAPTPTHVPRERPDVLVPGSHIMPGGEIIDQSQTTFAEQVLARLDPGALYRRAGRLGEIHNTTFALVDAARLRTIIDDTVRLTAGKESKEEGEPIIVFRACSHDFATVVLAYGAVRGEVRELRHLAAYPVCVGSDFAVARPGWNAAHGVYLSEPSCPEPLPLDESRAVLEDLVADFPFQTPADRANFFGLLLTPILRPAIDEPVPMHLIGSPMERTGKSKLVEIVFGITISGGKLAASQIGDHEDEREKRILSWLLRGQTLVHMDNLTEFLGSASLASMLTCSVYQGRLLGQSAAPTVPNGLTVVGTGNNVHATGEMAKRIVPIRLMPDTETPETRTDFRHPNLVQYVSEGRQRTLAALLGLIAAWKAAGRPLHRAAFGGFERWTAVVGGIMNAAGYPEWLSTMGEWRGVVDDAGQENRALVTAWLARYGRGWVAASLVYDLAFELDLYGWIDSAKTDRARRRVFSVRVLNQMAGRVVANVRVESMGTGSERRVRLTNPTNPTNNDGDANED